MTKPWIRYKATYTTWKNQGTKIEFESVEQSFANFAEKIENKLSTKGDFVKHIDIISVGVE